MKKYITAALLFCAALTAACSKETAVSADTGDTGALEMRVSATRAEADGEYDPLQRLAVRIYRASGELLRQYTAETLPSRLELLAGEYRVEVDAGEAVPASFTKRFYKGEKTFTVAAGQTTVAEVECKRQNVVAEVKFDATVSAAFGENFHAWVVAADAFDEGQVQQGGVPALNYTADGTGYFTMPEGATTLTTRFEGTHPDRGVIVREARFEGVQTGGKYSVSFRFSKDLPGFIECFVVKVDTSTDDYDDTFPFSPEPSIESDGFDMDQPQDFIPGTTSPKRYMITTMAAVKSVVIGIGDDSYEALNGTTEGVEVTRESDLSLTVTLSDAFFAGRPGGSHPVSIRVTDSAGAEATAISEYRLQGLLPIEKTDYDLWTNSLTLRALVLDPNVTTATFGLRVKDGEWSDAEGVNAGEGIYTATFTAQWKESVNAAGLTVHTPVAGTGVFAGNSYEARAALDGETVSSAEFQAAAGQVIPDGDMESGSLPCFGKSTSESTTFWGSGNAATSGLCAQSTKPGMGGSYCAKLESQSAFGLLAAGNLFSATFRFASLSGTASFGMPYQWTARPTALRLKYHATVGAVNKGTVTEEHEYIQDGQDRSRIFAVIVDWNSRHATVAGMGSPTGVWDPAKTAETAEGPVIAYGSLLIGETTPGDAMTTVEIPIEYYDRTTKPTGAYTLVISCTTSAYGDFKVGRMGILITKRKQMRKLFIRTLALALCLTGTAQALRAQETTAAQTAATADQRPKTINEMRQERGLTDTHNLFVPKGQWIFGGTASYSTHTNKGYQFLVIEGINSKGYTFRVSPMIAYAFRDNMALGGRFIYSRTLLKLDNAELHFGNEETGTNIVARDFYSLKQTYSAAAIWRQYIPLGRNKRFALFNEMSLAAGGTQARFANDSPVKGTYETGYTLSLGISPGIVAFATNNMAVEVNVGVMGISYTHAKQVHNQVTVGKRNTSMMNFKVNIFSIGLGMAFYL